MPASNVADLSELEILDARGRPTLAVTVRLADGTTARAGDPYVPRPGPREAVERRDSDPDRYEGKGSSARLSGRHRNPRPPHGRSWASLAKAARP